VPLKKIAKIIAGKASHDLRIAGKTRGCVPPPHFTTVDNDPAVVLRKSLERHCREHRNRYQQRSYLTVQLFNSASFQQHVSRLLHQLAHTKSSRAPIMD